MLLQRVFIRLSSRLSSTFSFLNLSFSSISPAVLLVACGVAVVAGGEFDEINRSSAQFDDDTGEIGDVEEILRRCMSHKRRFSPRRKQSLENSHRSGTTFRNP